MPPSGPRWVIVRKCSPFPTSAWRPRGRNSRRLYQRQGVSRQRCGSESPSWTLLAATTRRRGATNQQAMVTSRCGIAPRSLELPVRQQNLPRASLSINVTVRVEFTSCLLSFCLTSAQAWESAYRCRWCSSATATVPVAGPTIDFARRTIWRASDFRPRRFIASAYP